MAIGNWGSVIRFEVSTRKMLTFQNMKRTVSGRWESHSILNKKPKGEFKGPDASGVTLDILLSAGHGVNPRTHVGKYRSGRGEWKGRVPLHRRKESRKREAGH